METEEYKISFFRPTTPLALKNRNLIVKLFIIWAVAIFGFQVLLKMLEKPVPEDALLSYRAAWESVESGVADRSDMQEAARAMIQVMGKSTLRPDDYTALRDGLGYLLYQIYPTEGIEELQSDVRHLNVLKNRITSLRDEEYLLAKQRIISQAAPALGIPANSLLAELLAIGLDDELATFSFENRQRLPHIMDIYLTHNRSVLTDTIFLGFPFHYFYTAVFLLVFFIGLCWYYCYRTDRLHAKLNFIEKID